MRKRTVVALISGIVGTVVPCSCEDRQRGEPPSSRASILRAGAAAEFTAAYLFKPRSVEGVPLDVYLSPLLFLELEGDGEKPQPREAPGALRRGTRAALEVDTSRPAVYYRISAGGFGARHHDQIAFVWYRRNPPRNAPEAQGLRLSLDSEGFPAIYEVLETGSEYRAVFISERLDRAARAVFGAPSDGKTYAVESRDTRDVVVVGLVADGPEPMGPFVYLERRSGAVLNLRCRCRPSRVQEYRGQSDYELLDASTLDALGVPFPWDDRDAAAVEETLRLPPEF